MHYTKPANISQSAHSDCTTRAELSSSQGHGVIGYHRCTVLDKDYGDNSGSAGMITVKNYKFYLEFSDMKKVEALNEVINAF